MIWYRKEAIKFSSGYCNPGKILLGKLADEFFYSLHYLLPLLVPSPLLLSSRDWRSLFLAFRFVFVNLTQNLHHEWCSYEPNKLRFNSRIKKNFFFVTPCNLKINQKPKKKNLKNFAYKSWFFFSFRTSEYFFFFLARHARNCSSATVTNWNAFLNLNIQRCQNQVRVFHSSRY